MKTVYYAVLWSISVASLLFVNFSLLPVAYYLSASPDGGLGDCFESQPKKYHLVSDCVALPNTCKKQNDCHPYAGTCSETGAFSYMKFPLVLLLGTCGGSEESSGTCWYCKRICALGDAYVPDGGANCGIQRCSWLWWQDGTCLPPPQ
jgi:hypothetical protein